MISDDDFCGFGLTSMFFVFFLGGLRWVDFLDDFFGG